MDRSLYVMQRDFYVEGTRSEQGPRSFSLEKLLDERPDYVVFNGSSLPSSLDVRAAGRSSSVHVV